MTLRLAARPASDAVQTTGPPTNLEDLLGDLSKVKAHAMGTTLTSKGT
jgi:hypothetical protein